jgi:uncharacterized protein
MIGSMTKRADGRFSLYLVFFAAAWTGYVLFIFRHVQALGEETFAYAAVNISVRLMIWVLPVVLYLKFVDRVEPLSYLRLTDDWKHGVAVGLVFSALILAYSVIRFGPPHWASNYVTWNSILSTSFGIGFFEEIPFRGFILQKLSTRMNFWLANALASLVFVGMHLPGWLMLHLFTLPLALNIFVFSFALGAVFQYSRSLWSCVIGHSANDFFSFVLFHGQ